MRRLTLACLVAILLCAQVSFAEPPRARSNEYHEAMDQLWTDRVRLFSSMTDGLFEAAALMEVDPNKPMVALTFDDGPSKYTGRILDLLTRHGGKATFFMVGNRVQNYPDVVAQVARQGSEIATHTWSHPNLKKLSAASVASQLTRSVDALEVYAAEPVTLMRPPYGSVNDTVRKTCKSLGLPIIRWSIDTLDWSTKDAQATYDAIMRDVGNYSIILCHDIVPSTADAMEWVIPELVRRGYQLVTITEMFDAAGVQLEPGKVYDRLKLEE